MFGQKVKVTLLTKDPISLAPFKYTTEGSRGTKHGEVNWSRCLFWFSFTERGCN